MPIVPQQKYLQVIDVLEQEQGVVRQIDVAVYPRYSRADICRVVKSLKAKGLVVQGVHRIELSAYGKALGRQLNEVRTYMQETLYAPGLPKGLNLVPTLRLPVRSKEGLSTIADQLPAASGIIKQRK